MKDQRFKLGQSFDPNKPLVIAGAYLLKVEEEYPEIAELTRQQPIWESKRFIIFPVNLVGLRLLKAIAGPAEGVNTPYPLYDSKRKSELRAVVIYQTGYKKYIALYTYRLRRKRR